MPRPALRSRFVDSFSAPVCIAIAAICAAIFAPAALHAQAALTLVRTINTTAGNGTAGYSGDGGPATSAELNGPYGIAVDGAGDTYFADTKNCVVRLVAAFTGLITTVAGVDPSPAANCGYSGDNGPATSAELNQPAGIGLSKAGGILYIADTMNQRIRSVNLATGTITTVAGDGIPGFLGDGGPATEAWLTNPAGIAADAAGDLYIADTGNQRIRLVNATSTDISTYAGDGTQGFSGDGEMATSAEINNPGGVSIDVGILLIADTGNNRIRQVSASGVITTVAGNGTAGYGGDGGPATSAELNSPYAVETDLIGNYYIADRSNQRIRYVAAATKEIFTAAGKGTAGFAGDNGPALSAELNLPQGMDVDAGGNLYVADAGNNRIRRVNAPLATTPTLFPGTLVGASAPAQSVNLIVNTAMTISSITVPQSQGGVQEYRVGTISGCTVNGTTTNPVGTICAVPITFSPAYAGDRKLPVIAVTSLGTFSWGLEGIGIAPQATVSPGVITTKAGDGTKGYSGDGGPSTSAEVNLPQGFVLASFGGGYIADTGNCRIRLVNSSGIISTVAGNGTCGYSGDGAAATGAELNMPAAVALDAAGNLYIADTANNRVRVVSQGVITTIAGNGTAGYSGDNGPATSAELNHPSGLTLDRLGDLLIGDSANNAVRILNLAIGYIFTGAGNGTAGFSGDGGPATSAELNAPVGVAVQAPGYGFIADSGNQRIRQVNFLTDIIETVAGDGTAGFGGDGGPATSAELHDPTGLFAAIAGGGYIGDTGNNRIRQVYRSGESENITTVAGNGTAGFGGDGGAANVAELNGPTGVVLDAKGAIIISDTANNRVREVTAGAAPLAFPSTHEGSTSAAQTVTVFNAGNSTLTFTGFSASANFVTVAASTTCSTSTGLTAGSACTVGVACMPTTTGSLTGSLVITDNNLNVAGSSQTVSLTCTGLSSGTPSTTNLTSNPNPSTTCESVTFTATVTPSSPEPTGAITWSAITGCSASALSSGVATCITSAFSTPGTYPVVATYSGDSNYNGSMGTVSQVVTSCATTAVQFFPITPCRVVDTRNTAGPFGGPAITAESFRSFALPSSTACPGIPATASAYSLNVTAVPETVLNYLTIWPEGETKPSVSLMNSPDGRVKANAAIVPAGGAGGSVSVYVTQTSNVVLDINGYFATSNLSSLEFFPLTPCRLVDTRNANGLLGGPILAADTERDFALPGVCDIPSSGAVAYSLNFTAIPPTGGVLQYLTVWPTGVTRPGVSTLNDPTGTIVANAAIVPAGTSGEIAVYPSNQTNLTIDVNGYFALSTHASGGLSLYTETPCRVLDTRTVGSGGGFTGELTVPVETSSACPQPGAAQAYVFNATVIPPTTGLGFLTLYPDGESRPTVSTLNAPDGAIASNMAIVPTTNGSIDAYADDQTELLLDISAYFAP